MIDGIAEGQGRFTKMMDALNGDDARKALVLAVIHAYQFANSAYASAYAGNAASGVLLAGSFANHYDVMVEHIAKDLRKCARAEAVATMQKVSDWVEKFDLPGIPRFVAVNGITNYIRKTAEVVDEDMRKYMSMYMELRRSMDMAAAEKERK